MKLDELSQPQITEAELRKREVEALEAIAANTAHLSQQLGLVVARLIGIEHGVMRR